MIVAETADGRRVRVSGVVHTFASWEKYWLVQIPVGFEFLSLLVRSGDKSDVLDELADSAKWGKRIEADENLEEEFVDRCGNEGKRCKLEGVRIAPCKVHWFVSRSQAREWHLL